MHPGERLNKSGSSFAGFAMKTHSIEDVIGGYKQLKYRFLESTHIMCAYRIMDPNVAHMTDSVDGGKLGAGRRLVQMLAEESFENIAVYVVRHHRGPNIAPVRWE